MVGSFQSAFLCASLAALASGCAGVIRAHGSAGRFASYVPAHASPIAEPAVDSPLVLLASHEPQPTDTGDRELADTVWTIEAGTYAGMRVPLSIGAALGHRGSKEHFWRVAQGSGTKAIVGWKSSRYPIALAFRHSRRSEPITLADSASFWAIVDEMNADFGFEVFRPATIVNDDPPDVIFVEIGGIQDEADGLSRVTWAPSGELFDARVSFRGIAELHDAHVVTHEMMHALGFGHTNSWASVVSQHDHGAARLTPEDVAYAELAMHARVKHEWADTRSLIALAVSRESRRGADGAYASCTDQLDDSPDAEEPMGIRGLLPIGLMTVVSACSGDKTRNAPDTVAVPAAAVDTTTNRLPGETPRATGAPAAGVDTPITRKIGAPAPAKK